MYNVIILYLSWDKTKRVRKDLADDSLQSQKSAAIPLFCYKEGGIKNTASLKFFWLTLKWFKACLFNQLLVSKSQQLLVFCGGSDKKFLILKYVLRLKGSFLGMGFDRCSNIYFVSFFF